MKHKTKKDSGLLKKKHSIFFIYKYILYIIVGFFSTVVLYISSIYMLSLPLYNDSHTKECVALIHGLGRGPKSFFFTKMYLRQAGYRVITPGYPSTKESIDILASEVWSQIDTQCKDMEKIHIVTHSLGGIIARYILSHQNVEKIGHIVMLAPPNQGSEIVDTFKDYTWFAWINGPTGITLGTDTNDVPKKLSSSIPASVGIIAGSISFNPFYSYMIEGEDDGKVSINSTKFGENIPHIIIPSSHTFIMNNPLVLIQIYHFLNLGEFDTSLNTKTIFDTLLHFFR